MKKSRRKGERRIFWRKHGRLRMEWIKNKEQREEVMVRIIEKAPKGVKGNERRGVRESRERGKSRSGMGKSA